MAQDVLIVEDEAPILVVLEASLQMAGYSIFTASSSFEAEKILASHPKPQELLFVIDVALKNESGVDFAVSASKRFPSIRILFISGYIDELFMMRSGIPNEHVGFLSKPFTHTQLILAAERILA
jgi:two-component system, cell cycle sensor histidine kinase and response regulator CckA